MKASFVRRNAWVAAGTLMAAGISGNALAQAQTPAQAWLNSQFVGSLGGFVVSSDFGGNLNGQSTTNPDVDFDRTFGSDNNATRLRADALWRITPKHHVRFMYFDNRRTASKVLDQDIKWGDYTFKANGKVDSEIRFKIAELAYEYAFMREPNYEIAGSAGIHNMKLDVNLSGNATVTGSGGASATATFANSNNSVSAPLPVLGLRGAWAVSPSWLLEAQGQFFKVNMNGYDGSVTDFRLGATWMYNNNLGLGIGYNRFNTRVDVSRSSFNGHVSTGYQGVQVYVTGAF